MRTSSQARLPSIGTTTPEDAARLGHDVPVPRGREIGDSSAENARVAMRARSADFAAGPSAGSRDGRGIGRTHGVTMVVENRPGAGKLTLPQALKQNGQFRCIKFSARGQIACGWSRSALPPTPANN